MSQIQYWTSKINNIVKEICNIKSTIKNHKNNQNRPDKDGGDDKGNRYSYDNNPGYHVLRYCYVTAGDGGKRLS